MIVLFLTLVRVSLLWYGEKHLRVYSVHIHEQLRRACQVFFNTAS